MKRVALITIHSVPNYGSVLQTYATIRAIEKNGMECELIDYRYPNEWHHAHGQPRESLTQRIKYAVAAPVLELAGIHSQQVLRRRIDRFKRRNFRFTRTFANLGELEQADWSGYQAVIAGSDQIWNPRFLHGDKAFMLSFVPDGIRKVSFASSFACSAIPPELSGRFGRYLSRFDAITVREENALQIVGVQLGLHVVPSRVLDPTLLLSSDEWNTMCAAEMDHIPHEPYIVLYGLNYAFEARPFIYGAVEEMKRRLGVHKVVALAGWPDSAAPASLDARNCRDVPVERFVALMRNACGVVTSSFHGTAFALNFGRPLISVVPSGTSDDRQSSLLRLVGAESVIAPVGTPLSALSHVYDAESVAETLSRLRERDLNLIIKNIDPSWNRS